MRYREEKKDLFAVSNEYYLAHCISADFGMGKGIVVEFNKRFNLKNKLKQKYPDYLRTFQWTHGDCIQEGKVLNLITKERYYEKPSLITLRNALEEMKKICLENNISKVAMPKIGCGLDKLNWVDVKQTLFEIFSDTNIEIYICYL